MTAFPTTQRLPARCRSCDAPIWWATTAGKGQRMPIDPDPAIDGNLLVATPARKLLYDEEDGRAQLEAGNALVLVVSDPDVARAATRWQAHWASCPTPGQWRKRQ